MRAAKKILRRQSGIALLTTILLMLLMSSLLVGFILLINSGQKLSGINNDYGKAFYAAEAGMEKLTADLGTLFNNNYAPPATQINALQNAPPVIPDVSYTTATNGPGYTITSTNPTDANGNYLPTVTTISSGAYQGLTALATPYVMSVTARTASGSEVKLQRTTQTVGIPLFQFGIFCQTDCAFYAGSAFNFGGRTHSNGNLFLASGATLTLGAPVSAYKDIITAALENGNPVSNGYTGTVNVFNGSGTSTLSPTQGSLTGTLGTGANTSWPTISTGSGSGDFAGNLRNGVGSAFPQYSTGALQLKLGIVTLGAGTTQSIDVIRRPPPGEALAVTQERYFAQASMKILLSDNPADLEGPPAGTLPCTTPDAPVDLRELADTYAHLQASTNSDITTLRGYLGANLVPLATSGAATAAYTPAYPTGPKNGPWTTASGDGYWLPNGQPIIRGYIKIELQNGAAYNTCGWKNVTLEVLGRGYVGKNANPATAATGAYPVPPTMPIPPTAQVPSLVSTAASTDSCTDPHPNAIIRLERIRDNPSSGATHPCGLNGTSIVATNGYDYWPNVLFDTREGLTNYTDPPATTLATTVVAKAGLNPPVAYNSMVALSGVMDYIELDVKNAAQYLSGTSGGNGSFAQDPTNAPNNYVIYISDRRGNYYDGTSGTSFTGGWPPLSPSGNETGEYGFNDVVNSANLNGCPNKTMDTGEDLDGTGILYSYGKDPVHALLPLAGNAGTNPPYQNPWTGGYGPFPVATLYSNVASPDPTVFAFAAPPYANGAATFNCGVTDPSGSNIWPGTFVIHAAEARENTNFFFRRAVKLVNGSNLVANLNQCPNGFTCGLTIASENPVYIQGSYNCPGCTGTVPNNQDVGAAVAGDAVTLLSDNWNDVNSFTSPYALGLRNPVNSFYRAAVIAGKGVYFPLPTTTGVTQDYGTDGGAHNFLRYLENWGVAGGNQLVYEGSLVSLYFNRQAVGVYKSAGNVYAVPSRFYTFDNNFLNPSLLPPRTPLFRDVNTTGFTQLLSPAQ